MPEAGLSQPGGHVTSAEAFAKSVNIDYSLMTPRDCDGSGISGDLMVRTDAGRYSERAVTDGLAARTLVPGPINRKMACRLVKN